MIISTLQDGRLCVYDVPTMIKNAEQMKSLIYGHNNGRMAEKQREELYNQPLLLGLAGPMYNGIRTINNKEYVVIRYEMPIKLRREK